MQKTHLVAAHDTPLTFFGLLNLPPTNPGNLPFLQWLPALQHKGPVLLLSHWPARCSPVPTSYLHPDGLKPNLYCLPENLFLSWITAMVSLNHLPDFHLRPTRPLQSTLNPTVRVIPPKYKSNQINPLIKTHVCLLIPITVKSKISTMTCKASPGLSQPLSCHEPARSLSSSHTNLCHYTNTPSMFPLHEFTLTTLSY